MGWSSQWEEPVIDSKCVGCWPVAVEFFGTKIVGSKEVELDTTDWSRDDIILIFECKECKKEFDCNTTSFKVLCDKSKEAGWKMKWLDIGYETTCKECGE